MMTTSRSALLEVDDVVKRFSARGRSLFGNRPTFSAVDGVSLSIRRGESLGLVGESGCGKSTLARLILQLERPDAGDVRLDGQSIASFDRKEMRAARRLMQLVPQDPGASIDPRYNVGRAIAEPLVVHRAGAKQARRQRVRTLLSRVGLDPEVEGRKVHEFSGGQRQRISIARALALEPALLIADEPTSSLDVLTQAQILNLLRDLQQDLGLAMLFISHNLGAIRYVCDRVAVMYSGIIVEVARTADIFAAPRHPYTRTLIDAIPTLESEPMVADEAGIEDVAVHRGAVTGCRFSSRCPWAQEICSRVEPALDRVSSDRWAACHFADRTPRSGPIEPLPASSDPRRNGA